jgi:uncharacterized membrane protein (UPF0182 family)
VNQDRRARYAVALLLFLLVIAPILTGGVRMVVDWLWFRQEGFRVLFTKVLISQIELSGLAGVGFILIVGLNLIVAQALSHRYGFRVEGGTVEISALDRLSHALHWMVWLGVLLIGYGVSQWGMAHWHEYLLARNPVPMSLSDPLFGLDLSFYLFELPFRWFLYHLALVTSLACLLSAIFVYFLAGGVWVTPRGPQLAPAARTHLMVLAAIVMVVIAYRIRLGMYGLMYSERGVIFGAGYSDVNATLPVLKAMFYLSLITALLFLAGAARGSLKPGIYGIIWMVLFGFLGGLAFPELMQRFIVAPNEIEKEAPYIARAIEFTRKAYALDRFEEREFPAVEDLTPQDIQTNEATIRNVRLWDHRPLLTTFAQLQEIRTYYDFHRVDNDRYWIDGVYRQVSLSPRELNSESLPSRTWINEHLTYTHGYGLCLGPVNEYTHEGLPELFIKDLPPVSSVNIQVSRPEIYFGELPNTYCFVRTKAQEFDYPFGDQNVYATYEGDGGLPVEGFLRRLLFTLRFGELKMLLSTDITGESRLMIYRRILERAMRLTPFLRYDEDPYLVITDDGSLVWMLDGYTTSRWYPYSDPSPGVGNYLRNSVKVTINAYSGRVNFYVADAADPLIQAYARIFPGAFQPLDAMPKDLRAHIRYPEGFFSIQARKYALFHMTDPRVFYNKEDLWRVAQTAVQSTPTPMTPYYTIMKLAGVGEKEEFILMVPFTPARRDNMIAWMAARCDEPNYGKVLVFMFPKQRLVYGPQQIDARIDQDPFISQQLTLWGTGGSTVIRGNLFVIPVANSVIYVQPLYLAATAGGGLPQLTRVLVAYGDNVVMEPTLEEGLARIFGSDVSSTPRRASRGAAPPSPGAPGALPATADDVSALIRQANQHFERAQQLLRQGDFAGYGEENRKLGEVLKRLAAGK